jgi:hypothetical protein
VQRENAFFKTSPVDKYHLAQMNFEKSFFWVNIEMRRNMGCSKKIIYGGCLG